MVSKYFKVKTSRQDFKEEMDNLIKSLQGKKVLLYGAGADFFILEQDYNLTKNLNIIAISDKKFNQTKQPEYKGIRAIQVGQIIKEDFDYILVTNERSNQIRSFLHVELGIELSKIKIIFSEKIRDEADNYKFLDDNKFDKTLPKLIKKLENKKVVLYGAGSFLELIKEYFDISKLNIIGVSDKKFSKQGSESEFLGYKTIAPEKIKELKPDVVLVSTKFYIKIMEDLYDNLLKHSGIKLRPLVKKSFFVIFNEIRNS